MNSVNSDGPVVNGPFLPVQPSLYAYRPGKSPAYEREPEQVEEAEAHYRQNRAESLELCDAFQAFYGSNPAYHLDL